MVEPLYKFFECDNPECLLRFPGYDGYPRWNRCPVCRSTIHVVELVDNAGETINSTTPSGKLLVEVLLDNIRSALNVGSIFRTADGTGIQKLYLCGISPTPENPKVRKSSLGAEASIPWNSFRNGLITAEKLKSEGRILWALEDLPNAETLFHSELPKSNFPVVLVVGNEVCGVDPGIIALCDKVLSIPMNGKKHSYNVAIAFAIAAGFLLFRQWCDNSR